MANSAVDDSVPGAFLDLFLENLRSQCEINTALMLTNQAHAEEIYQLRNQPSTAAYISATKTITDLLCAFEMIQSVADWQWCSTVHNYVHLKIMFDSLYQHQNRLDKRLSFKSEMFDGLGRDLYRVTERFLRAGANNLVAEAESIYRTLAVLGERDRELSKMRDQVRVFELFFFSVRDVAATFGPKEAIRVLCRVWDREVKVANFYSQTIDRFAREASRDLDSFVFNNTWQVALNEGLNDASENDVHTVVSTPEGEDAARNQNGPVLDTINLHTHSKTECRCAEQIKLLGTPEDIQSKAPNPALMLLEIHRSGGSLSALIDATIRYAKAELNHLFNGALFTAKSEGPAKFNIDPKDIMEAARQYSEQGNDTAADGSPDDSAENTTRTGTNPVLDFPEKNNLIHLSQGDGTNSQSQQNTLPSQAPNSTPNAIDADGD